MPFKKGQSGNPGGRPRINHDFRAMAQEGVPEALKELRRIIANGESDQARVSAIKELFDRAHGKASQPVDGDGQGGPIKIEVCWQEGETE